MESCNGSPALWKRKREEMEAVTNVEDQAAAMLEEDGPVLDPPLQWDRLPCDPLSELEWPRHVDSMHGEVTAVTNEEEKQEGEEQKDRVVAMLEELQSGRWNGIDSPPGQEA